MKHLAMPIPDWFARSAVYQINPRTFTREGTIAAITAELPRLYNLGFRIVYLCPIFEADDSEDRANWSPRQCKSGTENPKNPYRMNDYFRIDSEYGTMDDLRELVAAAHGRGMRVFLDLVYAHIGPNAPILATHPEFARQNPDGSFILTGWNFPYLDFNCQGLREYLWSNMTYYIGALDVDGFRCDVGDMIPNDFWAEGRRRIRAIKPDAVLINEGTKYYRMATTFDCCYSFQGHERLYKLLSGTLTVPEYVDFLHEQASTVPSGGHILRDMDNHDTATDWPQRVELVGGHEGMEAIQVLNYSLPGVPMVYCGNELADSSNHSMFANRFHMGRYEVADRDALAREDYSLRRQEVMRQLNKLKAEHPAFSSTEMEWLELSEDVVAFVRTGEGRKVVVAINFGEAAEVKVEGQTIMENRAARDGDSVKLEKYGYVVVEA